MLKATDAFIMPLNILPNVECQAGLGLAIVFAGAMLGCFEGARESGLASEWG
jgi:hypothetical protein